MISSKPLTCKHCPFQVTLITTIKAEDGEPDDISGGFAAHRGWTDLQDHVAKAHPEQYKRIVEWLGTEWKLPYETVQREIEKAEKRCGTVVEAA